MNTASSAAATTTMGFRPPFTPLQWQELEHQALIFKYLMAGLPVPPELVIPIKKSFESMSMSARFFHHPSMGYCSFYGKKVDPEPGRCRRTDGKKWRCSKDAYPDSKYCERHMHRGRNRSRKPVETQTMVQSSSTVTTLSTASGSSSVGGGGGLPLHSINNPRQGALCTGTNPSQLQMNSVPYGIGTKEYRYLQGMKQEGDEHSFLSDTSGSTRSLEMDSSLDGTWHMMPSKVSSFPQSKSRNGSIIQTDYPEMQTLQDLGHTGITATLSKQQQQHCFFGGEYGLAEPGKPEGQSLRPFFDEWPKTSDSWSDLEDDRSNRTSFSTTQLSISIPMASSDFSATSSHSQNDD